MSLNRNVRLRFYPYPWWRSIPVAFQLLFKGYIDVEGVITDIRDYDARRIAHSTEKRGQAP